jgi:transcriptional regulator with XRE-family HTH domain
VKLNERIKDFRVKAGLTQHQCARVANVPAQRWSWFESDHFANPKMDTMTDIAKALGVSVRDLMGEEFPK